MLAIGSAFVAGVVFGLGLLVSQMVDPAKILGFLDVFGAWDASLALVMAAAIPIAAAGFAVARRWRRPLFAPAFRLPVPCAVDSSLVAGAILFGIGWGLVGYCPGPALVALGMGQRPALVMVAAMLVGMGLYDMVRAMRRRPSVSEA
jgi:uncharacterized membrane protein YedE/YeeE